MTSYIRLSNSDSRPSVKVGDAYKLITRRNYMEAMASRSTEVDTSDCDEVTESRPPVLRLRGAEKPERDTEDRFSQFEYISRP